MKTYPADVAAALRSIVGPEHVLDGDEAQPFAVDGCVPKAVVFPGNVEEAAQVMACAHANALAVAPLGGGTQRSLGNPPARLDLVLGLRRLNRLIAHEPADMTVTVEAGMPLAELQAILGQAGQFLPCDPPLGPASTVGGVIATRAAGPLRAGFRTVAERLLGVRVVTADGEVAKAGGRVVKNVSGYELGRLYAGSLGTLGILVEATFKVQPAFESQEALALDAPDLSTAQRAAAAVGNTPTSPIMAELWGPSTSGGARMVLGFGGAREDVAWERNEAEKALSAAYAPGERVAWGEAHALALRAHAPNEGEFVTARVHILPSELCAFLTAALEEATQRDIRLRFAAHATAGIARLHLAASSSPSVGSPHVESEAWADRAFHLVARLRTVAAKGEGYLVVERAPLAFKARGSVWGDPGEAFPLQQAIKRRLDPKGILNPGRFVGGL